MSTFDLHNLENLSPDQLTSNSNFFNQLLQNLENELNLKCLFSKVEILYNNDEKANSIIKFKPLDIGVRRSVKNDVLYLEFFNKYRKFLPFIVLREAYYCLLPKEVINKKILKTIINEIVTLDLSIFSNVNEWNKETIEKTVDSEFLKAQMDRFTKFLKLHKDNLDLNIKKFIFEYIRRNYFLIKQKENFAFYDEIFKDYVFRSISSIVDRNIVESLRVLTYIFYKVKSYRALLDYKNYFTRLKESGEIQTTLSLRKFANDVQWIGQNTYIGPAYQISWNAISVVSILCQVQFHPALKKSQVFSVMKDLPFYTYSRSSDNGFASEFYGFLVIPEVYIDDLIKFFDKLVSNGWIVEKQLIRLYDNKNQLNLNYFIKDLKRKGLIDLSDPQYDEKLEVLWRIKNKGKKASQNLSLLDWLVLDRIRYWSITGFGFERRTETLRDIKIDLFNEIRSKRVTLEKLNNNLKKLQQEENLKNELINLLVNNAGFGFFYIRKLLNDIMKSLSIIKKLITISPSIKTLQQLLTILKNHDIILSIDDNIALKAALSRKIVVDKILPKFFASDKELEDTTNKYKIFSEFFENCSELMVFNLISIKKIIEDESLVKIIYAKKIAKLRASYKDIKINTLIANDLDDAIDSLVNSNPPIAIPTLTNTINTTSFAKYYNVLLLKHDDQNKQTIDRLKSSFSRLIMLKGYNLNTNERFLSVETYIPNLKSEEKKIFASLLYTQFKKSIVSFNRYFFDGLWSAFSLKDYYDFEKHEFFYTSDLFEQYYSYAQKILGEKLKPFIEIPFNKNQNALWPIVDDNKTLIKVVDERISKEQVDLSVKHIYELLNFHLNLKDTLLDNEKYNGAKKEAFFNTYIEAIKFTPCYQKFGFSKYYLYIKPISFSDFTFSNIDFRLLFGNNFQNIKYSLSFDKVPSLLVKYIFPYRSPNISYINYLIKTKKVFSEYALFFVKNLRQLFHFDYNLYSEGWDLDANRFKAYAEMVLLQKEYTFQRSQIKKYDVADLNDFEVLGNGSNEYESLTEFYDKSSSDLKSTISAINRSLIEKIHRLLKKDLIFPYLKIKNIDLMEKIYIFLPNLRRELVEILVKVFAYFNFGFVYEIEGEYYIYEREKKSFENGLFIKLYLPDVDLSEFQKVFSLIFASLGIEHFFVLNDVVDGAEFLKEVFGSLDFLKTHNPIKNLEWSEKDKAWRNRKLLTEKMEPIYPKL